MAFRELSRDIPLDGQTGYRELAKGTLLDGEEPPKTYMGEFVRGSKQLGAGVVGLGEAAANIGTGLIGSAAGGLAGISRLVAGYSAEEATQEIGRVSEALTYKPQTKAGREFAGGAEWGMGKLSEAGKFVGEKVQDVLSKSKYTKPLAPYLATAADTAVQTAGFAAGARLVKPGTVKSVGPEAFKVRLGEIGAETTETNLIRRPEMGLERIKGEPIRVFAETGPQTLPPGPEFTLLQPQTEPKLISSTDWLKGKPETILRKYEGPTPETVTGFKTPGQVFLTSKEGTIEVKWNAKNKRYEATKAPEIETVKAIEEPPTVTPPVPEKLAPEPPREAISIPKDTKAVDEAGQPIKMYHASKEAITEWKEGQPTKFFSRPLKEEFGENVTEAYLDIKNPAPNLHEWMTNRDKYDGAFYPATDYQGNPGYSAVVKSPKQIIPVGGPKPPIVEPGKIGEKAKAETPYGRELRLQEQFRKEHTEVKVEPAKVGKVETPKDQKKYLIDSIDEAIKIAPTVGKEGEYAVIEIPGDGIFKIRNNKYALGEFKNKAKGFPANAVTIEARNLSQPSLKPTGKRLFDFEGEYYNEFKPRREGIIESKEEGRNVYNDGWYSNGFYAIKTEKPVIKGAWKEGEQPDIKAVIPKTDLVSSEIVGENYEGGIVTAHFLSEGGESAFANAKLVDSVLTKYPDAKPFVQSKNPASSPILFKSKGKPVAVVMPIRIESNMARITEQYERVHGKPMGGTGRKGEAGFIEIPVEDIRRAANRIKEFWVPMSTLGNRAEILGERGKALGAVARVERIVEKTWENLKGLPDEAKTDIFKAMSGQVDVLDLSPENASIARRLLRTNDMIGEMLVKRGIIKPGQFEAHKGQYIRYMYLKHVLGDDANIPTRPNGKLDLSYQKSRKDLTWEQRRALGIIENVALAEPLGMAKALSDTVKYDYLEKLVSDPRNVWKPSIVEITEIPKEFTERGARAQATILSRETGDKHEPVHLRPDAWMVWNRDTGQAVGQKMGIGQLVSEVDLYRRMAKEAPNSIEIKARLASLERALDGAKEATQNVPADFVQMPDSKSWGPLAGSFVRKPIARDLMGFWGQEKGNIPGLAGSIEKMAKLDETATGIFKTFKAPLNLPTAARNTVSNFVQLGMSGMAPWDIPIKGTQAVAEMLNKSPEFTQAFRNGLFKTNWSVTELGEVMSAFRKMQGDTWGGIIGKIQDLAKYYGRIDDIFKFTKYLDERSSGSTVEKAVIEGQKWGMDYSLADPSVKWARRHAIPFASYTYKIAPLIAESLIKRPWIIGSLVALPYAMMEVAKEMNPEMSESDWAELRKSLPTDLKERGTWMIVPVKVGGKYRWFDYSYMLPWGNYVAGGQAMKEGNIKGVIGQFGIGGTPLLTLVKTFAVDPLRNDPPREPFSNQPIYNRLDPPVLKAAKTMEFFYSMMAPSMLTRYGALGYTLSIGKEDRWGRTVDVEQAIPRWFGVNLQEANPKVSAVALKAQINALRDEFIKVQTDPNMSPERKNKYRMRLLEEIKLLTEKREK